MIFLRRLTPLVLGIGFLAVAISRTYGNPELLIDPRSIAFTLLVPWLLLGALDSLAATRATFADLFATAPEALPAGRRAASASRINSLGGTSLAAGLAAGIFALVAGFNQIAASGGQAGSEVLPGLFAGLLLGPVYGLLLKTLLYEPVAVALNATSTELGETLD